MTVAYGITSAFSGAFAAVGDRLLDFASDIGERIEESRENGGLFSDWEGQSPLRALLLAGAFALAVLGVVFYLGHRDTTDFVVLCPESCAATAEMLIAGYCGENPDVSMRVNALPDEEYTDEAVANCLDEGGANLAVLTPGMKPTALEGASLRDMQPIFEGDSSCFTLSIKQGDPLLALPLCGEVGVVLYRPDLMEAAGGSVPRTWDDLYMAVILLDSAGVSGLCLEQELQGSYTDLSILDSSLTYGLQEEDVGSEAVVKKSPNEGFSLYTQTRDGLEGLLDVCVTAQTHEEALELFAAGDCAMVFATSREYASLLGQDVDCGAFAIPGKSDKTHYSFTPTYSLAVSKSVRGSASDKLFAWLLSATAQQAICDATQNYPVLNGVAADEEASALLMGGDDESHLAVLSALWRAPEKDSAKCIDAAAEYVPLSGVEE